MKVRVMVLVCFVIFSSQFSMTLAAEPSFEEVGQTIEEVMAVYSVVMMGLLFGTEYENPQFTGDFMGESTMTFKKLDVKEFWDSTPLMFQESMETEVDDLIVERISGFINVMDTGELILDVTLKGGSVKTLKMDVMDEDATIIANGKVYEDPSNW